VRIHPILIIFIFISFFTGSFFHLLVILTLVFIHELGHFIAAKFYKWKISHIKLWVFGGVLVTEEYSHKPLREQLIVTLSGPFQHIILYFIIFLCSYYNIFSVSLIDLLLTYNTMILLFNFIPIWPLDGGRVLFILFCARFPYRKAFTRTIITSIICALVLLLFQLIFYSFTLSAILIMLYLIVENVSEWKQRYFVFIRFLFQKYYGDNNVDGKHFFTVSENTKLIDVLSLFKLEKLNVITVQHNKGKLLQITEKDCLNYFFSKSKSQEAIGKLL